MIIRPFKKTSLFGLGRFLICPAVCVILIFFIGCGNDREVIPVVDHVVANIASETETIGEASATLGVFEKFRFQTIHHEYQKSYLDLIKKINITNTQDLQIREKRSMFLDYQRAYRKYRDVVEKIQDYSRDQRLRCFTQMKSVILAVLYYDKKSSKKMFKFDPQKLIDEKMLKEVPHCPEGGEYSINYKDGKRFFRCSLHGTLKQN